MGMQAERQRECSAAEGSFKDDRGNLPMVVEGGATEDEEEVKTCARWRLEDN
jgi:hypothetical protein